MGASKAKEQLLRLDRGLVYLEPCHVLVQTPKPLASQSTSDGDAGGAGGGGVLTKHVGHSMAQVEYQAKFVKRLPQICRLGKLCSQTLQRNLCQTWWFNHV